VMTEHVVHTPGEPATLALSFDLAGKPFAASGKDAVFCRTELRDARGTVIPTNGVRISLGETGAARLLGQNPIATEAGIATVLLESDIANPATAVFALGIVDVRGEIRALTAAASPDGTPAPAFTVHYTTDGSEPTPASTVYRQPILKRSQLRVALVVGGTVVARVDAPTPNLEKVTASTKPAGFP
jgi:hypothetical protein